MVCNPKESQEQIHQPSLIQLASNWKVFQEQLEWATGIKFSR